MAQMSVNQEASRAAAQGLRWLSFAACIWALADPQPTRRTIALIAAIGFTYLATRIALELSAELLEERQQHDLWSVEDRLKALESDLENLSASSLRKDELLEEFVSSARRHRKVMTEYGPTLLPALEWLASAGSRGSLEPLKTVHRRRDPPPRGARSSHPR
jgi:hypothetical protein